LPGTEDSLRPIIGKVYGEVRLRRACAGDRTIFAIGEGGELFSWGNGCYGLLGHGDELHHPSPKRIEALRGIRLSSVAVGMFHALALAEDGMVYAWGSNSAMTLLGIPHVEEELLPKPVEALRGVRVGSVFVAQYRSYAVADTGEVWAWAFDSVNDPPLGHGEQVLCSVPRPIESLRGVKVDAVAAGECHTLALADDGSVYVWGNQDMAAAGALGLGASVRETGHEVPMPQRSNDLRPPLRGCSRSHTPCRGEQEHGATQMCALTVRNADAQML
jgi:alpha-tubulin suppressor-like RCC1 family protein